MDRLDRSQSLALLRQRRGFSLIELLVVIAIIGILAGLLLNAVNQAMSAAHRLEAQSNMRQLGIACHVYHSDFRMLPTEKGPNGQNVYVSLLPYVEMDKVAMALAQGKPGADNSTIRVYTIPSRRPPGGWKDFGYRLTTDPAKQSIFDTSGGLNLSAVSAANGASNTLLLASLAMKPSQYGNALMWNDITTNSRTGGAGALVKDSEQVQGSEFGGPFRSMPVLYADGHVSQVPLSVSPTIMDYVWSFNNSTPFDAP
jgi:prepilin-type N-terminal cleavage/methylation domain-containing protein/prepilin-type processing-associated H-X9-DG protein